MMETFDHFWRLLALHGHCDEFGSVEYQRVRDTFERGGCAVAITRFICREANRDATTSAVTDELHRVVHEWVTASVEEVARMHKREEQIVLALRALVKSLPLEDGQGFMCLKWDEVERRTREAAELLAVIDAQK